MKPKRAGIIIIGGDSLLNYRLITVTTKPTQKIGFPKGYAHRGESFWECAKRETCEEIGIVIQNYSYEWVKENITFYVCKIKDNEITADSIKVNDKKEIASVNYCVINDLKKLDNLSRPLRKFIEHLENEN